MALFTFFTWLASCSLPSNFILQALKEKIKEIIKLEGITCIRSTRFYSFFLVVGWEFDYFKKLILIYNKNIQFFLK